LRAHMKARCEIARHPVAGTTTLSQKHYAEEI